MKKDIREMSLLLLLEKLQDLTNDEYKHFKWYLAMKIVDSCKPIPKSKLEGQDRMDTVSCMIDSYGEATAVKVSVAILRKMNVNNIADDLEGKFEGGEEEKLCHLNSCLCHWTQDMKDHTFVLL
uniref:Pyrin domain-containing protein n=1 Tax=Maylandia zebra TaxID=106582 RepID=A0A3P9C8K6_9CICH